jgi:hypothetical protein
MFRLRSSVPPLLQLGMKRDLVSEMLCSPIFLGIRDNGECPEAQKLRANRSCFSLVTRRQAFEMQGVRLRSMSHRNGPLSLFSTSRETGASRWVSSLAAMFPSCTHIQKPSAVMQHQILCTETNNVYRNRQGLCSGDVRENKATTL